MKRLAFALVLAAPALGSRPASADVVPPSPPCPPGRVKVYSHGMSVCVQPAPTNCPNGWKGKPGDECTPAVCEEGCGSGEECVPVTLCVRTATSHRHGRHSSCEIPQGVVGDGVACDDGRTEKPGGSLCPKRLILLSRSSVPQTRVIHGARRKGPPTCAPLLRRPNASASPPGSSEAANSGLPDAAPVQSTRPVLPDGYPAVAANPPPPQRTSCGACAIGSGSHALPASMMAAWLMAVWGLRKGQESKGYIGRSPASA